MSHAYPEQTPAEIHPQLSGYRVIDVREVEEWHGELGRIPGGTLVPLGELEQRQGELRGDRPLLVVCRSGNRSGKACARLLELGFEAPTNLAGGMLAWNEAGLPVERTDEGNEPPQR
jgi:rhodanese-related sulfurtransferase